MFKLAFKPTEGLRESLGRDIAQNMYGGGQHPKFTVAELRDGSLLVSSSNEDLVMAVGIHYPEFKDRRVKTNLRSE